MAQNMSKLHFAQTCHMIPEQTRAKLLELQTENRRAAGGKEYWAEGAIALGVYESKDGVLRFRRK